MRAGARLILVATVVGALLVVAWLVTRHRPTGSSVVVGSILPLTGPGAAFGESSRNALLLAAEEINAADSPLIELLIEDGMTDPRTSVTAFNRLYDSRGTRIFTTTVSSVSLAIAPLAEQRACLLFANASHPEITVGRRLTFRYSNTAADEAQVLLDFVSGHVPAWSRLYLIALNDDYGRAYAHELTVGTDRYSAVEFVGQEFYDRTTTDFRTLATKVISKDPDAILLVGFGRAMGLCLRQLRELGYAGPFVASLGFILTTDALTAAGDAIRGGYLLNFAFVSDSSALAFRTKYRARYGADPTPNAVIDYGTLHLIAQGIRSVGQDPLALAAHLHGLRVAHLPTGDVTISPQGDIVAPVNVVPVPPTGSVGLWNSTPDVSK